MFLFEDYLVVLNWANPAQDSSIQNVVQVINAIHQLENVSVQIRRAHGSAIEMENEKFF